MHFNLWNELWLLSDSVVKICTLPLLTLYTRTTHENKNTRDFLSETQIQQLQGD